MCEYPDLEHNARLSAKESLAEADKNTTAELS